MLEAALKLTGKSALPALVAVFSRLVFSTDSTRNKGEGPDANVMRIFGAEKVMSECKMASGGHEVG
jgi:hypothetical protein